MRYLLSGSALLLLSSLVPLGYRYRITCLYLLLSIPAVLGFQSSEGWLHSWYAVLVAPVALLRVLAGLEILYRQVEGFRRWRLLAVAAFLVAGLFAGMGWVQSASPDALQRVVDGRRLVQIWLAGVFLYVETFWLTQGGGWYRRADHLAALFGVLALNHGAVSFLGGVRGWNEGTWAALSWWSWLIDSGVYVAMATRSRLYPGGLRYSRHLL